MNDLCTYCGLTTATSHPRVVVRGPGPDFGWAHTTCAEAESLRAVAAAVGPIVDTWLMDDKPAPGSAKIRVSEIASLGAIYSHRMKIAPGAAFEDCLVPSFMITLHGGKEFWCARTHMASLIGAELVTPEPGGNFGSSKYWKLQEQPPGSPSVVATEKFRDDLIIAWAESIKAARA